jgi:hypothetical protein
MHWEQQFVLLSHIRVSQLSYLFRQPRLYENT